MSNESSTTPVFFDDFNVTHTRGVIIEDNAYYPYGLKIAGISARAAIKPITKEGYQGDYTEHDEETGYDEFALRSYDAQIGRWIQNDPKEEFTSGYVGMGNDPINNIDPDGGGLQDFIIQHFAPAIVGAVVGAIATNGNANDKLRGAGIGFAAGFGASYLATEVPWEKFGNILGDAARWVGNLVNPLVDLYILNNTRQAFYMGHLAVAKKDKKGVEYLSVTGDAAKDGTADYSHYKPDGDPVINQDDPTKKEYHLDNPKEGLEWVKKHYNRTFSIKVTKKEAKKVINGMIKFAKSGPYKTIGRNCADAVIKGLKDAKLFIGLMPYLIPNSIYDFLKNGFTIK